MDVRASRAAKRRWPDELAGIVLLFLASITLFSLVSYDAADSTWFHRHADPQPPLNWIGTVGANLAEFLLQVLGSASFLVPVVLVLTGWNRFRGKGAAASYGRLIGFAALLVSLAALLDLLFGWISFGDDLFRAGGYLGGGMASALLSLLGRWGSLLAATALLAGTVVLTTRFSFSRAGDALAAIAAERAKGHAERFRAWREERRREADKRAVARKHAKAAAERAKSAEEPEAPPPRPGRPIPVALEEEPASLAKPTARTTPPPVRAKPPARSDAAVKQPPLPIDPGVGGVALPPLELLNEPSPQAGEEEKDLVARARQLEEKFHEFAVEGQVVAIHPGPVVTTFEFKPDAGVKYAKITGLVDDLCLGLKAESVRIDRLPGRATVGIEVPNRHQETIYPRELLASDRFRNAKSRLTLALGKDISGEVFVSELERMPHLLIAGATGAGKSVGLNGMIASILYKATPSEVRFIMIDTKMIELGMYQDIPHLLVPVVTEPRAASTALKWAVREMEARYRKLAAVGVRNIEQFNALLAAEPDRKIRNEKTGDEDPLQPLPYIVIVIDEMADLMMVSSADVEESVMRLAQMARAVGIHLILATQRPSVDVITGTIKANFPARIAFRVSQRVDSRTIIDQQGAEHLLGRGDMLFLPPGSARLMRLHGGYITEPELNRIVAFLKKQARPIYDESVLKEPEEERGPFDPGERDGMFVDAVKLVLQEGQCSITLIQRRLRLGYARAARIVDMMEQLGVIGPADGAKPREVLVGPEFLETLETAPR